MSRLRAVGRWLLWRLHLRSDRPVLDPQEWALMSVLGEQHDQLGRDFEALTVERDDLAARLRVAEVERDRLRFALAALPTDVAELRRQLAEQRRANVLLDNRLAVTEGRPVVEVDA